MEPSSLHPLQRLRSRIALLVLLPVVALAVVMSAQSTARLSSAYDEAGRQQLQAIASTWDEGFRTEDLSHPSRLQARVARLQRRNPRLHKISLSWHDRAGVTRLVSAGHVHDPDGTKRNVTTARPLSVGARSRPAPIDAPNYRYRDVRASDSVHYAELNHAIRRGSRRAPVAVLELHYDLKGLDEARAAGKRSIFIWSLVAAALLGIMLTFLLGRAVVRPLDAIRGVANRIRAGDKTARLAWRRGDEIGVLARDFDRMADELLEALKDPLTGLLNHRAFQERLGEELGRAERGGYPVSLVAVDIDDFKLINDAYGHAVGDQALKLVADAVQAELRGSDICGRVGGDEFMLAIVGADIDETETIVGRLRAEAARIEPGASGERLTVSAGVAGFPRHSRSQDQLLHLADGAMYWAKSQGKDRSFVYSSSVDFALSAEEAAERNLRAGLVNTVHALARAVDAKDGYTHSHSQRVARYAVALGEKLGFDRERLEKLRTAGVLHDVGKIGISEAILLKPASLTKVEFSEMQRHSELGRDIISGAGMEETALWVAHLHERYDGNGYPDGLAGSQIPLESRLLHCADALEAMTSSRVYREALPLEVALEELERGAATQFDPELAAALVEVVRTGTLLITYENDAKIPLREQLPV